MEISISNLNLEFNKKKTLKNIEVKIQKGKITTIVGKNASGKSTLLKTLVRILKPRTGEIAIDGKNLNGYTQRQLARKMSFLPQTQEITQSFTVREVIALGRCPHQSIFCKEREEDKKMIEWAIEVTNLNDYRDTPIQNLSGGVKQRALIAMNLAQGSDYIFLDEPTTFLDIHYQIELLNLIQSLNRDHNKTIVMVLHDLNQAFQYSDYLFVIKDGEIYLEGDPNEVSYPQILRNVFGVKAKSYQSDDGKVIFYPDEVMSKKQEDLSIEKKFLIACVREKILQNYSIDANQIMTVELSKGYSLKFLTHNFKTCERFWIKGNISVYTDDRFLKILEKKKFFGFMQEHISVLYGGHLLNSQVFSELVESSKNLEFVKEHSIRTVGFNSSLEYVKKMKNLSHNFSPLVFYEQSVIDAHPNHPTAKVRFGFSDTDLEKYSPECRAVIDLKILAVPKKYLKTFSVSHETVSDYILNYSSSVKNKVMKSFETNKLTLEEYGLIIIHPWQYDNILKKQHNFLFEDRILVDLNVSLTSSPLISLRSLSLARVSTNTDFHVKTALSVLVTGDVRVLPGRAVESGVSLSKIFQSFQNEVNTKYGINLHILKEVAGSYIDLPKSLDNGTYPTRISDKVSFLLRQTPEHVIGKNQIVLPCAALIEDSPCSAKKIIEEFIETYKTSQQIDSIQTAVLSFFKEYVELLVPGFIIYMTKYGLSLEGHLQNTLVSFENGRPVLFFMRDLSDIRIFQERLSKQNILFKLNNFKQSAVFCDDLSKFYMNVFYSLIQGHISEIVIQLASIYEIQESILWRKVRSCIEKTFDKLSQEQDVFDDVQLDQKALLGATHLISKEMLKMRIKNEISNYELGQVSNPLQM